MAFKACKKSQDFFARWEAAAVLTAAVSCYGSKKLGNAFCNTELLSFNLIPHFGEAVHVHRAKDTEALGGGGEAAQTEGYRAQLEIQLYRTAAVSGKLA